MSGFSELAHAATEALRARPLVPLALATLVEVEGSSYRQPGARLLVDAEARVLAGAISGGCLEGDVAARAADVCAQRRAITLRYDLRDDLETIWGFGSACDGIAHIVLEPLPDAEWLNTAAAICHARHGGAVLTVIPETKSASAAAADHAGGTRRSAGTIALLHGQASTGSWERVEFDRDDVNRENVLAPAVRARAAPLVDAAQKTAHAALEERQDALHEDVHNALRGSSSARSRYFVEPLMPVVSLYLIGAGRGAEAFARIASAIGWEVTVIDHRPSLLEALTLPDGVRVHCARAEQCARDGGVEIVTDERTAVALLTHIFDVDAAWLRTLLPQSLGYLGVLGSRQRAARLLDEVAPTIAALGPAGRVLHAPIGLDLGGETPESIALAAVAEIEAVMNGRPGGFLRERESPIHTRTPTPDVRPAALVVDLGQCTLRVDDE